MPKPKELEAQMRKIISGTKSSEEGFNGVIDLIGSENWEEKLLSVKKDVISKRNSKENMSNTKKDILKILNRYNEDFSKYLLKSLKDKIKEMEALGVIGQFELN